MNDEDNSDSLAEEGEIPVVKIEVNIQEIIRERKVERRLIAEQKRQMDLQRIRDMKSAIGINPLQLFPKEIWMKLLDELGPEDQGNMWQIHPLFRDLMNTRIQILFPQLVKVEEFKTFLYLCTDFPDDEVTLRCINKSTMKSFDCSMEEKLKQRIKEAEAISSSYLHGTVNISYHNGKQRRMLYKMLESFLDEENPAKLYFPRELSVSFQSGYVDIEDVTDFQNNITSLLECIGDQIWNFRFVMNNKEAVNYSRSESYTLFHRWITLLPNLKWLEMYIPAKGLQVVETSVAKKYPFPCLASLERLSFHSQFQSPEDLRTSHILELVLGANQHLKMLDIAEANNTGLRLLPIHLIKSLPLTGFSTYDQFFYESTTLLCLQNIVNFNWPLKSITFALDYTEEMYGSMNFVIRFLNKFSTLEKVRMKKLHGLHVMGDGDDETNPGGVTYLDLPNLTDLEVSLSNPQIEGNHYFFFSLYFLLPCKKLKTLRWTLSKIEDLDGLRESVEKVEKANPGKAIHFGAGLRILHQSNIWDVFPLLDTVDVDISCAHQYRRAEVDRRMSVSQFLKSHGCRKNVFRNCVFAQE